MMKLISSSVRLTQPPHGATSFQLLVHLVMIQIPEPKNEGRNVDELVFPFHPNPNLWIRASLTPSLIHSPASPNLEGDLHLFPAENYDVIPVAQ
uniref:Uncharacterized protein n=1 Tax=Nothobranchius kuhntae TaxID=321403 RepID=A0A1A8J6E0_NOTKU